MLVTLHNFVYSRQIIRDLEKYNYFCGINPYVMTHTEQILSEFKSGNIEIFYNELYAKLLVYASRHLGPDYAFLAEDCVQDAVYKAYEQRETFKSILTFKAFLYSCIHHAAIDIQRKNQARSNYLSQQEDRTEFLNSVIEQETLNLLYDAIERLPEKYRRIFELHFEQGLKNAEIAALLGVTESAVKKQKAQMLESLRKDLQKRTGNHFLAATLLSQWLEWLE